MSVPFTKEQDEYVRKLLNDTLAERAAANQRRRQRQPRQLTQDLVREAAVGETVYAVPLDNEMELLRDQQKSLTAELALVRQKLRELHTIIDHRETTVEGRLAKIEQGACKAKNKRSVIWKKLSELEEAVKGMDQELDHVVYHWESDDNGE
ncbi:hypothetical protein KEM55_000951 [Ascosphaera atra]|nr:hypothetical protein KEM55_000951 [Ascosphaera atra]